MGKKNLVRAPLSDEQLMKLGAADLARIKLGDDEMMRLRDINRDRMNRIRKRNDRLKIEEEPILQELRSVGWDVESIWDLINEKRRYAEAVPILLKHLMLPYSDRTREALARSLAVPEPEVQKAWRMLVKAYREAPIGDGLVAPGDDEYLKLGAKEGLACTLSAAVTEETMEDLIDLVRDKTQGETRVHFLSVLRKSKSPLAKLALKEAFKDPELRKELDAKEGNDMSDS